MLRHWFVILSTWSHQRSESSTQVAVTIGEIIGHFLNDAIMRITTRRNRGVFEAESRLWWVWSACLSEVWPLKHQGEISALQNLARVLGGFSVGYFQVPWATKHGALQTLGCEAA